MFSFSFLFFLAVLEFELRVSCLQGRYSASPLVFVLLKLVLFYFLFLVGLGFELRASPLQNRLSAALTILSVHFAGLF
jgi:hypothetical protein